ncbi:PWWP domain-containing protein [Cinnamomum micranthum f. kanehirae]|uniref:PWWP domain-containing protein n=1 Tax=Cinnamomum micranthum f. kanehirae TaxID=337451 RepID=A0A443PXP3_9MAGN|nr:PWWP domain-containing protein [Cinnamomum micranthum f. kanehirae]
MSSSEGLDLTSLAPPQTLTQPSSSHDLPAAPLPDSGVLPEGQNQDSGTLMDPDPNPNPNPKGGGVLSKDERFSVGNQDGVDIGIDDNDTGMSDQKEVCNPGDEDVPTDAGIGGVVEIAENIGGMDENGRNQVNGMHMMPSDVNQDFKSVDVNVNVNEGGSMVVDVEASKEIVVEEVEVVGEASSSLPSAVGNNVAMEDENRVVDACVEREGFDCLGDQKLGGHVVESNVSLSDERGEKQVGGSGDCEIEVSVNVDKVTSLDGDGENIAGSHVAEDGISVLGENRMIGTPAMDMDASLDRGEGKFVDSCASEIGAAVLGESTPAGNFGASVVVDEQKIAGSDLSEMGLPKLCDNQIASNPVVESETSGEKNARSDITELEVSVTSNLQMMGSAAEHLETHLETDGKKLAEMNDPEGGISLLSENQMTGSRAVGLGVPLPMDENLNSEVKNTMEDISRPDDADGNGSEGEEMEASGRDKGKETNEELTLKEENTENEVEAGYDGTLKTEDVAAVKLPVTEEKQNIGPMNPTTASIRNEYQASYSLPLEKKGQFSVSDLIWGKVRSHPWWPGQIFDPSDSSDLAIKYKKKGAFLVAYFGDQTFAWCEDSQLKPFCTQFPRMEKQSTTEAFLNAVNCALDEVSRRVQLGLTCSCTPEEVSARIKNQRIDNAGIREGASGARGADMSLFEPVRLLEYIKELALLPLNGGERLELVIAKAQLMSFYSSKGYLELPAFHVHGGLVENDTDFLPGGELPKDTSEFATPISISEDKTPPSLHSGEEKAKGRRRSSHKRNQISEDSLRHTRKQKSLAELMSGKKASNIVSGGKSSTDGKATGNSGTSPSGKKRKAVDSFPDDSVQKRIKRLSSLSDTDPEDPSAKKTFVVGDCICRVAGKLTGSPPILKFSGERFQNNAVKVDSERNRAVHVGGFSHSPKEKQKRKIGIPKEYSSPDELLSQLCLAARDPMKGYSFLSAVVSFFTDFRNSIHLKHSSSGKKNGGGKSGRARSSNSKTSSVEFSELDEMNDSYWTDRIIQGSPEEEPSQKSRKRKGEPQSESPRKRGRPRKQSSSLQSSSKLDSNLKQQVNEDMDGEEECSKLEPEVNEDMNGESQLQRPKKRGRPRKQSNSLQSSPKLDSNLKQQVNEAMDGEEDCSPTALILFFNAADSVPSVTDLSKIFSRYGPLKESDIMRKSNHAKVVFSKRSDAEVAFSSAGKFSIFGPALVSYQLKYLSPKPKASLRASRHSKEDETSAERSNLVSPQLGKDDTRQTRDSSEVPGNETSAETNNLVSPQPGNDDAGQTRDGSEVPGDETSAERNSLVSPQPGKDEAGQTRDDSEVPAQVETKNSISLNENIEAIS